MGEGLSRTQRVPHPMRHAVAACSSPCPRFPPPPTPGLEGRYLEALPDCTPATPARRRLRLGAHAGMHAGTDDSSSIMPASACQQPYGHARGSVVATLVTSHDMRAARCVMRGRAPRAHRRFGVVGHGGHAACRRCLRGAFHRSKVYICNNACKRTRASDRVRTRTYVCTALQSGRDHA